MPPGVITIVCGVVFMCVVVGGLGLVVYLVWYRD